jgi:hypothetical protein
MLRLAYTLLRPQRCLRQAGDDGFSDEAGSSSSARPGTPARASAMTIKPPPVYPGSGVHSFIGGCERIMSHSSETVVRLACCVFVGGRADGGGNLAKNPPGFVSRAVRRPRRPVPSTREPALTAFLGAIKQDVGDRVTALASCREGGKRCIPNCLAGFEHRDLAQSNPFLVCRQRCLSHVCLLVVRSRRAGHLQGATTRKRSFLPRGSPQRRPAHEEARAGPL